MGLDEVKQDIIASAEREAQHIREQADAEASLIKKDAQKQLDAYKVRRAEDSQRIARQIERRECAQADFDAKKRVLDKKTGLISRIVDGVIAQLISQPEKKRRAVLRTLLSKAKADIPVGTLFVAAKDRAVMKSLAPKLVVREKPLLGGLIAETPGGDISVDYSYDQLLAQARNACIQELHSILFSRR